MIKNVVLALFVIFSMLGLYLLFRPREEKKVTSNSLPPIYNKSVERDRPSSHYDLINSVGYPQGLDVDILNKDCFIIGYYEPAEQAAWAMYQLDGKTPKIKIKRENNFYEDEMVETGSASVKDYRKSGYDRGHLVPAGDMKESVSCFRNSFLLSNISPQKHEFNTGLWKRIEEKTRKWSKNSKVVVITGGVLRKGLKTIGNNSVFVPEAYYKIIYKTTPTSTAIAFLCPNKNSDLSIEKFVVSIDKIEKETGLNFLPQLPDEHENEIEAQIPIRKWF